MQLLRDQAMNVFWVRVALLSVLTAGFQHPPLGMAFCLAAGFAAGLVDLVIERLGTRLNPR